MNEEETGDSSNDDGPFSFDTFMESFAKVTLAGFGGALAGMSLSRGGSNALGSVARVTSARRIQQLKDSKTAGTSLASSWAIACMTFAGITEICRVTSPVHQITSMLQPNTSHNENSAVETVGDLTMGGMIAGAVLRGNIRPNAPPLALVTRLGAGMGLGFVAGSSQYGIEYIINRLEQQESSRSEKEDDQ